MRFSLADVSFTDRTAAVAAALKVRQRAATTEAAAHHLAACAQQWPLAILQSATEGAHTGRE